MTLQYFCDYCCRSFRDNWKDRRKHRNSIGHQETKAEYELQCLQKLVSKYNFEKLTKIFSPQDFSTLKEILAKCKPCKYHFCKKTFSDASEPTPSPIISANKCKYGLLCKYSHLLNEEQIKQMTNYFFKILSKKHAINRSFNFQNQMYKETEVLNHQLILSKPQLHKELFLNIWLEKRFNLNNQSNLITKIFYINKMVNK